MSPKNNYSPRQPQTSGVRKRSQMWRPDRRVKGRYESRRGESPPVAGGSLDILEQRLQAT